MPNPSNRLRRISAGSVLLLYLAVAALPAPHAQASATDRVAHLEGSDTANCPPPHDHDQCVLCRVTSSHATAAGAATPRMPLGGSDLDAVMPAEPTPQGTALPAHPPRGPPTASL